MERANAKLQMSERYFQATKHCIEWDLSMAEFQHGTVKTAELARRACIGGGIVVGATSGAWTGGKVGMTLGGPSGAAGGAVVGGAAGGYFGYRAGRYAGEMAFHKILESRAKQAEEKYLGWKMKLTDELYAAFLNFALENKWLRRLEDPLKPGHLMRYPVIAPNGVTYDYGSLAIHLQDPSGVRQDLEEGVLEKLELVAFTIDQVVPDYALQVELCNYLSIRVGQERRKPEASQLHPEIIDGLEILGELFRDQSTRAYGLGIGRLCKVTVVQHVEQRPNLFMHCYMDSKFTTQGIAGPYAQRRNYLHRLRALEATAQAG